MLIYFKTLTEKEIEDFISSIKFRDQTNNTAIYYKLDKIYTKTYRFRKVMVIEMYPLIIKDKNNEIIKDIENERKLIEEKDLNKEIIMITYSGIYERKRRIFGRKRKEEIEMQFMKWMAEKEQKKKLRGAKNIKKFSFKNIY